MTNGREFTTPVDSNEKEFNPFAGSKTPIDGRCRALLVNYYERYGEKRYCTIYPTNTHTNGDSDRCKKHKGRDGLQMRTQEAFKKGLEAQTVFHYYDKIHPTKKALALLWYEDLLNQSVFDFKWNLETITVDFSNVVNDSFPTPPQSIMENGRIEFEVPFATEHKDASTSLFLAATSKMKMLDVDSTLMMMGMERDVYEDTELDYESGEWNTLSGKDEHHLNLPYDRLIRSHSEFLEHGGVGIDDPSERNDNAPDEVVQIFNSPDSQDPIDPEMLFDEESNNIPIQ